MDRIWAELTRVGRMETLSAWAGRGRDMQAYAWVNWCSCWPNQEGFEVFLGPLGPVLVSERQEEQGRSECMYCIVLYTLGAAYLLTSAMRSTGFGHNLDLGLHRLS